MSDSQYQLQSVFRCSPHVMLSLSFSPDANFLAYAGYDGVRVFDLKQMRRIYVADRYSHPTGLRHVASNLAWVSFEHTRSDVLVLGCLTGGLTGLVLSRGELRGLGDVKPANFIDHVNAVNGAVTALKPCEPRVTSGPFAHIAAAYSNGTVSVWRLSALGGLSCVFSVALGTNVLCKALSFDAFGCLHIFTTEGDLLCLDDQGCEVQAKATGIEKIGHAILDAKGKSLVVHTGDAIRRLTLHSLTLRGTFGPPAPRVVNPPESRILGYIEDHTRFVAGTASHHAQIIDIATGAVEELPRFPELEAMQVVSGVTTSQGDYLAIGSASSTSSDVLLLHRNPMQSTGRLDRLRDLSEMWTRVVEMLFKILFKILFKSWLCTILALILLELTTMATGHFHEMTLARYYCHVRPRNDPAYPDYFRVNNHKIVLCDIGEGVAEDF